MCQGDGPGQQEGRAGAGQDKPWQQQRGHNWKETLQHRLRVVRSRTRPKEVIPEKSDCHRASQARDTRASKEQVFNGALSVFPGRLSPRSRPTIRTRAEDVVSAETTCGGNSRLMAGLIEPKQMVAFNTCVCTAMGSVKTAACTCCDWS